MRIVSQGKTAETVANPSTIIHIDSTQQSSKTNEITQSIAQTTVDNISIHDNQEFSKEQLQQVVEMVNEFLQINSSASKFVLHEGLDRYFVQVIDSETEEVLKEIPPKRLLDAFYEMQKLLGMIVDEKI
ncbi:flagellar protein FlaG [Lysinibacillus sp. FSL L8-0312]|uniref:flagellar protein FlaG n=1 Tax=Lysinibacillus sp. FSL L8-0312 TaxID=2921521 RepID=UPI0030F7E030